MSCVFCFILKSWLAFLLSWSFPLLTIITCVSLMNLDWFHLCSPAQVFKAGVLTLCQHAGYLQSDQVKIILDYPRSPAFPQHWQVSEMYWCTIWEVIWFWVFFRLSLVASRGSSFFVHFCSCSCRHLARVYLSRNVRSHPKTRGHRNKTEQNGRRQRGVKLQRPHI